jgi:hypothetical protein
MKIEAPPIYTLLVELAGWTFDRTASIPKSQRFTFGQRLDGAALDAVLLSVRARFARADAKAQYLQDLTIKLEEMRVLWRLVHDRKWISQQQLFFANKCIDEAGRMTGGWLKQTAARAQ